MNVTTELSMSAFRNLLVANLLKLKHSNRMHIIVVSKLPQHFSRSIKSATAGPIQVFNYAIEFH